jgi:signal peptidase I
MFLVSLVIIPVAALIAGAVSSTAALVGLLAAYLGLIGLWLFAVIDAWRLASRSQETAVHDFQKPLVYALFVVAGLTSPMLSTLYVRQNLLEAFYLPTGSMSPTLRPGDHILANKTRWRVENLERSDLVVFRPPDNRHRNYVKRLIGLPGDRVEIVGTAVTVNGEPVSNISPSSPAAGPGSGSRADHREQTVPAGMCFVLGDNRENSHDSRDFGPVSLGDIVGVAEYVYLPADSWSRFGKLR